MTPGSIAPYVVHHLGDMAEDMSAFQRVSYKSQNFLVYRIAARAVFELSTVFMQKYRNAKIIQLQTEA